MNAPASVMRIRGGLVVAAVVAAAALAGCGGGREAASATIEPSATTPSAAAAAASGAVVFTVGRCVGDPGGQRVCTDGHGLTMPAPTPGDHDDADGCTWSAHGHGVRQVFVCRTDG